MAMLRMIDLAEQLREARGGATRRIEQSREQLRTYVTTSTTQTRGLRYDGAGRKQLICRKGRRPELGVHVSVCG
jgi:hypothetical protein